MWKDSSVSLTSPSFQGSSQTVFIPYKEKKTTTLQHETHLLASSDMNTCTKVLVIINRFWIHTYSLCVNNRCWMFELCNLFPSYMVQDTHLIQGSIGRQNCYDKILQMV